MFAEIAGYWGHRATHEIGVLWRFHRLHHTIETMDWLAPNRRHPVDMAVARASVAIPMIVLGFGVPTIAAHFIIKRFQGLLVHANVRLNAGPLTWLIASPEFHHWHHADHPEAVNKNYADSCRWSTGCSDRSTCRGPPGRPATGVASGRRPATSPSWPGRSNAPRRSPRRGPWARATRAGR